jgi:D-ribose pyranose/furanose isomerase RbsD
MLTCTLSVLLLLAGILHAQTNHTLPTSDWRKTFDQRLPVYGHRNWIIVADAAFPAYSNGGIETVVAKEDLPTVLNYVAKSISSSKHVRATVFLDKELQFVEEKDYRGATKIRQQINSVFDQRSISSIPHSEVLSKIDDAGKTFRVLFIKTATTIPYTSVYIRLDCGYVTDEVEKKIRSEISSSNSR